MGLDTVMEHEQTDTRERNNSALCDLAAAGLVEMLDPKSSIFCDTYQRTEQGMRRERLSPRYTMMTLLGLHSYEESGRRSPVAIAPVFEALLENTDWIDCAGDVG